jgi:hypothetical protein
MRLAVLAKGYRIGDPLAVCVINRNAMKLTRLSNPQLQNSSPPIT